MMVLGFSVLFIQEEKAFPEVGDLEERKSDWSYGLVNGPRDSESFNVRSSFCG